MRGDRLAIERLARKKMRDAQTDRANDFVIQFSEKSLAEIGGQFAEPYGYLSGFSPDANWLAGEIDSSEENILENVIRYALTRGFVLGCCFKTRPPNQYLTSKAEFHEHLRLHQLQNTLIRRKLQIPKDR